MSGQADPPIGYAARIEREASGAIGHRADVDGAHLFAPGSVELRKRLVERLAYATLLLTTAALVVPLVTILGYLVVKAWPVLSWSFLVENPKHYMTAGGL